jgi:hypothetical protein
MKGLKRLSAAVVVIVLPLATSSTTLAQGWGPCTRPGGTAVGAEGPAMNGGQLMAGVGQCRRIGSWYRASGYWGPGYGYSGPHWRRGFARYY